MAAATDNHDGQAAIITAVLTATFWCVVGGICWLAALSNLIRFGGILWTDYHQPCQAAVAEEAAAEGSTRAVGVTAVSAVATPEAAEVVPHRRKRYVYFSGTDRRKAWKHLRRAQYWGRLQQAKLLMQQWREQYEAQVGDAAVLTPAPAPVQAHSAPASAQEPSAPAQEQPALTPAPAPAQERAAAAPPPQEQSAPRRHRHRIRRRANGAPRSCVLESGRWINLPRARRAAVDAMPAVQKSPHTVTVAAVQEAVQQCRFYLIGGCTRNQCTFGPPMY